MDTRPKISLLEDIQDLDRKLIKLIAKRVELVEKIGQNKSKGARFAIRFANEEKELRKNWETAASKVSRDERFLRDAFSLLQELELIPAYLEERANTFYNLAPPRRPVSFELPAISSIRESSLWAVSAAATGAEIELKNQIISDSVVELIKALNQAGAHLAWENRSITNRKGKPLEWQDKSIFVGNDTFNFYLLSALALGQTGVVKFNGDSSLKLCDLSIWRNTIPLLGARLAHVVPKSKGLPAHQECSGQMPDEIKLPDELTQDAITALLIAAPFWPGKIKFTDTDNDAFKAAKVEILPLFTACGINFSDGKSELSITPGPGIIPSQPELCSDLCLSSVLLSLPAMVGGEAKLKGSWPKLAQGVDSVENLFSWAGLELEKKSDSVCTKGNARPRAPKEVFSLDGLPAWAVPLAIVFGANHALNGQGKAEITARELDVDLAQDFLQIFGAELSDKGNGLIQIIPAKYEGAPKTESIWTAPDPAWGMALALGAYLKPNISLTNPAIVSRAMPNFWAVYNRLPSPSLVMMTQKEEPEAPEASKPKRKLIAKGVGSDLAELRADYEPEPTE